MLLTQPAGCAGLGFLDDEELLAGQIKSQLPFHRYRRSTCQRKRNVSASSWLPGAKDILKGAEMPSLRRHWLNSSPTVGWGEGALMLGGLGDGVGIFKLGMQADFPQGMPARYGSLKCWTFISFPLKLPEEYNAFEITLLS